MAHTRSIVCGVVPLLLTCGLVACIGPAGGPQSAPGAGPAQRLDVAPSVDGQGKGIVWNGEGVGCEREVLDRVQEGDATCKTTLGMVPSVGHDGSTGLRFHAEGSDFQGGGWNWFGWWPENAGSDVSGFKNLSFWFKAELKSPAEGPDPASLAVLLGCSAGKAESESALLVQVRREIAGRRLARNRDPARRFAERQRGRLRSALRLGVSALRAGPPIRRTSPLLRRHRLRQPLRAGARTERSRVVRARRYLRKELKPSAGVGLSSPGCKNICENSSKPVDQASGRARMKARSGLSAGPAAALRRADHRSRHASSKRTSCAA